MNTLTRVTAKAAKLVSRIYKANSSVEEWRSHPVIQTPESKVTEQTGLEIAKWIDDNPKKIERARRRAQRESGIDL